MDSPPTDERELSLRQHQAAILEAHGLKTGGIASALGVHDRTVMRWRDSDLYRQQVKAYEHNQIEALEPIIEGIRAEMALAVHKAVRTLSEALDDRDKSGRVTSRAIYAVQEALKHAKIIAPAALTESEGGDQQIRTAVIRVEMAAPQEEPKRIDAETTATED